MHILSYFSQLKCQSLFYCVFFKGQALIFCPLVAPSTQCFFNFSFGVVTNRSRSDTTSAPLHTRRSRGDLLNFPDVQNGSINGPWAHTVRRYSGGLAALLVWEETFSSERKCLQVSLHSHRPALNLMSSSPVWGGAKNEKWD